MSKQLEPRIVQPEHANQLHAFGNIVSLFISAENTNDTLSVLLDTCPPGGGPPQHIHHNEDELFLVVEGKLSVFVGGNWSEVGPGSAIYLPKGIPHGYRNVGSGFSRHWVITSPGGFERCFARMAEEFAKPGGPNMSRIDQLSREYGYTILGEYPAVQE